MHFNLSDSTDKCGFVVVEFGWLKLFKYIRKGQLFNSDFLQYKFDFKVVTVKIQITKIILESFFSVCLYHMFTACDGFNLVFRIVEDQA